jgi:hypothetical protein
MPTTTLLAEIVIVGFLFFLSVLPFATVIFQTDPQSILTFYGGIPLQFQLAAAYVAGVVWNRVCDQAFSKLDERIIRSKFPSKETYQAARIEVVLQGEQIRDYIGNFRSLIRIARASSILLLVYLVAVPVYIFGSSAAISFNTANRIAIVFSELLLSVASIYAWFRLERGYVAAVYDAYSVAKSNLKQG